MSAQAASISSLISTLLLTDYRVLRVVWDAPFTQQLDWPDLREQTYLAYQPWVARLPDHVFDSAWRLLIAQQKPDQSVLLTVLKALGDEFLELRHSEVRIRSHLQGAWQQGVISRQSSLPNPSDKCLPRPSKGVTFMGRQNWAAACSLDAPNFTPASGRGCPSRRLHRAGRLARDTLTSEWQHSCGNMLAARFTKLSCGNS
jgi:hypothetical protein